MRYLVPVSLQTYFPIEAKNEEEANDKVDEMLSNFRYTDQLPKCEIVEGWTEGADMVTT